MARSQLDVIECLEMSKACLGFNLRKCTRAVSHSYDEALRPLGLRGTQLSLLAAIRVLGPVTVNRLAEPIVMDRTTLTRNLKPLEKHGLIRINPGKDRREREVVLTTEGQKVLARAFPLWRTVQAGLKTRMGQDRMNVLLAGLDAAMKAVS